MVDLGYESQIQITSAWCTKHVNRGNHARHSHGNTFLAGVYYLSGNNKHSGTRWYNPNRLDSIIKPSNNPAKRLKNYMSWYQPFEEGMFIVFPGWLEHNTDLNHMDKTGEPRFIMGVNSLPLGKTNQDEFDRYCYHEAMPEDMISNLNEVVR